MIVNLSYQKSTIKLSKVMNIKVKICGITNLEDALLAIESGADALGFVFYNKSSRYCSPEDAFLISKKLPPFVSIVGLFVNAKKEEIDKILAMNFLNAIQFHGEEKASFCEQFNFPYFKAFGVNKDLDLIQYEKEFSQAKAFLLDNFDPVQKGGTGKIFDWNILKDLNVRKPIIIAGGLNSENIISLIDLYIPYAVDVSGGVESEKGKKDKLKLSRFISIVKNGKI